MSLKYLSSFYSSLTSLKNFVLEGEMEMWYSEISMNIITSYLSYLDGFILQTKVVDDLPYHY